MTIEYRLESGKETHITIFIFFIIIMHFCATERLMVLIPHLEQNSLHRCMDLSLLLEFQLSDGQQLTTDLLDVPNECGIGHHFAFKNESRTRRGTRYEHPILIYWLLHKQK